MDKTNLNIAIVVSDFNDNITHELANGAKRTGVEAGIVEQNLPIFHVPGAVEIPLCAQRLAQTRKYDAILCFGAVIKGETDHYHFVAEQASQGCQRVMLDHSLPVLFGVLTTLTLQQAIDRSGGAKGHVGEEYMQSALDLLETLEGIG